MSSDLQAQTDQAIFEAIMHHTVGVIVRRTELASGVLLASGDRTYVATAKHHVDGSQASDFEFLLRPSGTLLQVPRLSGIRSMVGRRSVSLPISRVVASSDVDDLALLEVAGDIDHQGVQADSFEGPETSPATGERVIVVGFPEQLVRGATNRAGEQGVGALPLFYVTTVSGEGFQHDDVRPEAHYLLAFAQPDDDTEVTRPRGMSGGGVWKPLAFPGPGHVWSPLDGIELVGIQVSWFEKSKLLKAVRVERLAALLAQAGR